MSMVQYCGSTCSRVVTEANAAVEERDSFGLV